MKSENFAKLIIEKCTTSKGELRKRDMEMLYHLIHYPKSRKSTFTWLNRGRNYRDTYSRDMEVLTKLGVDYRYMNDAPRGGQNGNYIIITKKGYNRIKPFITDFHKYVNNKRFEDILKIAKLLVK